MKNNKNSNLFLDTVKIEEVRKYSWLISGVTTTPTFFVREKIDYGSFISNFRREFPDLEIHIEALGSTSQKTEEYLQGILKKDWFDIEKVVIKIPIDFENLLIVSKYSKKGVKFNTHLVFNTSQAYLAAMSGTTYVCPLIGRFADNMLKIAGDYQRGGENDIGKKLLGDILGALRNNLPSNLVKVMASSIRTVEDFQNSIALGADAITIPTKILEASIKHEYTSQGIKFFLKDMGY